MAENLMEHAHAITFGMGEYNVDKRMELIQEIEDQYLDLAAKWLKTVSVTADNVVLANDVMRVLDIIRQRDISIRRR